MCVALKVVNRHEDRRMLQLPSRTPVPAEDEQLTRKIDRAHTCFQHSNNPSSAETVADTSLNQRECDLGTTGAQAGLRQGPHDASWFRVQSLFELTTTANRLSWPYKPCLASSWASRATLRLEVCDGVTQELRDAMAGEPQGPLRAMRLSCAVANACVVWVFVP